MSAQESGSAPPPGRRAAQAGPAYIQSLARGIDVIRSFDGTTKPLSLSEVATRTGLTRATARRFLLTLAELGYVRSESSGFSLTPRVLEIGYSYLSSASVPQLAEPRLEELVSRTRESASLSVLDEDSIVYIARVAVSRIMTVGITIGTRFPAFCTSMGRVLLAALPEDELERFLQRASFEALTPYTVTEPDELRRIIGEHPARRMGPGQPGTRRGSHLARSTRPGSIGHRHRRRQRLAVRPTAGTQRGARFDPARTASDHPDDRGRPQPAPADRRALTHGHQALTFCAKRKTPSGSYRRAIERSRVKLPA